MLYYVDREEVPSGDHEVHREDCRVLPSKARLEPLGEFFFCSSAVKEARKHFTQINCCETCLEFHHERVD